MAEIALPVLFTVFVWWFSTGVILYLDGLAKTTYRWSLAGAGALLALALYGLQTTSNDASVQGAYIAFTSALVAWGFNEMLFLFGYVTGPRREVRDVGATGWQSFRDAALTVWHHELALLATGAVVLALTWGGENQFGLWTFLVLWFARLSTKLNAFLGVPNMPDAFLPDHLSHLTTYIPKKPMNLLFPVSVTLATVATAWLTMSAVEAASGSFERTGFALLATLAGLAVLEHWFLVIPLPTAQLWNWGLASRTGDNSATDPKSRSSNRHLNADAIRAGEQTHALQGRLT